jgi:hypothetical protein
MLSLGAMARAVLNVRDPLPVIRTLQAVLRQFHDRPGAGNVQAVAGELLAYIPENQRHNYFHDLQDASEDLDALLDALYEQDGSTFRSLLAVELVSDDPSNVTLFPAVRIRPGRRADDWRQLAQGLAHGQGQHGLVARWPHILTVGIERARRDEDVLVRLPFVLQLPDGNGGRLWYRLASAVLWNSAGNHYTAAVSRSVDEWAFVDDGVVIIDELTEMEDDDDLPAFDLPARLAFYVRDFRL